jgi:hypothetical protein
MVRKISDSNTAVRRRPLRLCSPAIARLGEHWPRRAIVLLALALALSSCGGGGSHGTTAHSSTSTSNAAATKTTVAEPPAPPVSEPNAVVARVGDQVITKAMFAHQLAIATRDEGPGSVTPVPPAFSQCIARLKAASTASTASGPKPTAAELKSACHEEYLVLETRALDRLIVDDWTEGGAAELNVAVSESTITGLIEKYVHEHPPGALVKLLAERKRTLADLATQEKVQLLGEGIRKLITLKTSDITHAQVVSYYDHHKASFGVPERRVLEIARTSTREEALKVKREIASGESFASAVSKIHLQQPIYSTNGLVPAYASGMYAEPPLNNAIFAAKPNVLSGPVKIYLGYYVFEVKGILPAQQKTLAQSEAAIRSQLPGERYEQALVAFIKRWRVIWTAKTSCEPGYVVPKCKQFKPSAELPQPIEDPYTLD